MILTFKEQFIPMIASGKKRKSIRDHQISRWKQGMTIQFYDRNPRNGGKLFGTATVNQINMIQIHFTNDYPRIIVQAPVRNIRQEYTLISDLDKFARTDGFSDWQDMKQWFIRQYGIEWDRTTWSGIEISWDDFKSVNVN